SAAGSASSTQPGRSADTLVAHSAHAAALPPPRRGASVKASVLSLDDRLERLDIEFLLCHQLLQPAVLFLESLHALYFTDAQATVLRLPAVARLLADAMLPAHLADLQTAFLLAQDRGDLLGSVPL